MKILVTGARGFVGKNLVWNLRNIQQGKNRTRDLQIDEILELGREESAETLADYAARADFVFHLAGVNRPKDPAEFMTGNRDFTQQLLSALKQAGNSCPVMLASSVQASLSGRYAQSDYGRSKLAGEEAVFSYAEQTGAPALVYRLPNLFGKWCRPNYNSAVATFCYNKARDLPITVNDPATELELLYIDDLVETLLDALQGKVSRCDYKGTELLPAERGRFCYVPGSYKVCLGEIVKLLECFRGQPESLMLPEIPTDSFAKKLYSAYLSYLPRERVSFPLKMNKDERGSFTELLKTPSFGQVSVNISKPGITKGQHWHNSKWEFFMVVSGRGRIQMRSVDGEEIWDFDVSGDKMEAVHMLPGYTHNIINLSDTEDLVTVMWANEPFDPARPDTFFEKV